MDSSDVTPNDELDAGPFGKLLNSKTQPPPPSPRHMPMEGAVKEAVFEYSMDYPKRGIAVIINNRVFDPKTRMPERSGTDVDANNLKLQYTKLGFEVFLFTNVNLKQLEKIINDASKTDHSECDCFCMSILTHGEEGVVYATNGTYAVDELFEPFKGNNCKTLIGKPKLFFIQACRGTKLDDGVEFCGDMTDASVPKIPAEADFLLAYSVVPGYFSWRNSSNGSWFAQALTQVLNEFGHYMDLMTMMTRVNYKVAYEFESNATRPDMNNKKQIPCITSMLTRDVYFREKKKKVTPV